MDDPEIGLEDSLGLSNNFGLEDDFPSELLSDSLLASAGVDGLLCNDSLGLPDGFNLEEALQLVGLNEQPEVSANFWEFWRILEEILKNRWEESYGD